MRSGAEVAAPSANMGGVDSHRAADRQAGEERAVRGLIVHEWFEQSGGAERVVDEMVRTYPEADLYCLWNDAPGRYTANDVTESWIAHSPLRHHKATSLPVMPTTWRHMRSPAERGEPYDWMLVSSHLFAHHARLATQPDVRRFVYVHTPARYLWEPSIDTRGVRPLARAGSRRLLVKPGITGLWQVNGRSDLPLDESIRLDLSYVENWSVVGDLMILIRTWRAVIAGRGAY